MSRRRIARSTFLKGAAGVAGAALAAGWTPAFAQSGGILVPGAAPLRGRLEPSNTGRTVEFAFDYPGGEIVYSVELQITPDSAIGMAGFQVYNPTGAVHVKGGAQSGLVPNVAANVISRQKGRYIVQVYNQNLGAAIDFTIRVASTFTVENQAQTQAQQMQPSLQAALSNPLYMYLGTYTEPPDRRKGQGVVHLRLDTDGTLMPRRIISGVRNPSFLAVDPHQQFLYAVNEVNDMDANASGGVSSFSIDKATGNLTWLNTQLSNGAHPAHLSVDPTGEWVLVANYTGGTIEALPIMWDGSLGDPTDVVKHTGKLGPNSARQNAPHPHQIGFDPGGNFILVPDLGLDAVFVYRFSALSGGKFSAVGSAPVAAGAGPRHFAFHPSGNVVYVINELNSTITVFGYDANSGAMAEIQTVPTLPADFKGTSTTAEIKVHPSGKFVYGSNRGHDSIAIYTADQATGKLTWIWSEPVQGRTPRSFEIDPTGQWLFVANQDTSNLVPFAIDQGTGRLVPTGGNWDVGTPVCVVFARPA